jgi:uncharacterized membrane protein
MSSPQDEELRTLRTQVAVLTARIYELERRAGIEAAPAVAPAAPARTVAPPPPPPFPAAKDRASVPAPDFLLRPVIPADSSVADIEGRIGKVWLNRIGIFALLAGVAYFIKLVFDNGWVGPGGRVAIGLVAGIAVVLWSERFRKRNYSAFSYSLKAVGIGTLYFSLWGAFQVYHLIPSSAAFVAMIAVTAATTILALTQDAEILAAYALIGGFSTPALLSTHENHEIVLFSYVAILDLGMLVATKFKPWRRLMWGAFAGTAILFMGWYGTPSFYTKDVRGLTVFFAALFAAIFAAIPLVTPLEKSRWHRSHSVTLTLLPLANAGLFFLALFDMYDQERITLTWYALALGAVYLGLSNMLQRRADAEPGALQFVHLLHVAIAIAFITIAVPLKLNDHWITLGWLVESAVLLYIALRTRADFLRYFAGATLALGVLRLVFVDSDHVQNTLLLNSRFATYLVAIAILAGIVDAGQRFASAQEMPFVKLAGLGLNVLSLIALTLEAHDYFSRQMTAIVFGPPATYEHHRQLDLAWNFSYSAIWLVYGAGMMAFGFWKREAFVRWQALVLTAVTIGKVFVYDTWALEKIYRVISFLGLGVVLMAISYIYHRDWLKLSSRSPSGIPAKGTTP